MQVYHSVWQQVYSPLCPTIQLLLVCLCHLLSDDLLYLCSVTAAPPSQFRSAWQQLLCYLCCLSADTDMPLLFNSCSSCSTVPQRVAAAAVLSAGRPACAEPVAAADGDIPDAVHRRAEPPARGQHLWGKLNNAAQLLLTPQKP